MMLAKMLARQLDRIGIHYCWVMVALIVSLMGVLIAPIRQEFAWDTADVSGAIALMFVLFACTAPFSGALMLRYGVTRILALSASLPVARLCITPMGDPKWQ